MDGGRTRGTRVYGHRGAPGEAPENTLVSFRRAHALGADGIEFDVRLTLDGEPVVVHDDTLDRTTSGSGPVAAALLSEVQALSAGAWMHPRFAAERVPTLAETCAVAAEERLTMAIELKAAADGPRLANAVARTLTATGWLSRLALPGSLVVTSFDLRLLRAMGERLPGAPLGLLLDEPPPDVWPANWVEEQCDAACRVGAGVLLPRLDLWLAWADFWPRNRPTLPWCSGIPGNVATEPFRNPGTLGLIADDPIVARTVVEVARTLRT
jgi:glycerophosphoryl diester phosphodiesterase